MKKFSFSVQVAICWHRAWPSKPNNAHTDVEVIVVELGEF